MRSLPSERAIPAVLVFLCAAALLASAALADTGGAFFSRDEIAKALSPSKTRGIRPVSGPAASPRMTLSAIQFEFDSDRLTGTARQQVAEVAAALEIPSLQEFSFAVMGHTDSVGSDEYNRDLSLRRARSVKRSLVAGGVSAARLVEVGLGESYPKAGIAGDNPENRRVEVVNLGPGAAAAPAPARSGEARRRGRALLIGIDRYRNVSPLVGTVNDAHAMRAWLSSGLGFDDGAIRMLLDGEATRDNILRAAEEWLIDGTGEGDEVFLYYSGHGFQQLDDNADESDGLDETLVPVDVTIGADGVPRGMITDDEIAALLARLSGRRVHVVIDACHSGTGDRFAVQDTGSESWRYVKMPRGPDGSPLRFVAAGSEARSAASAATKPPRVREAFVSSKDPGIGRLDVAVWAAVKADQKALVDEERLDEPGSVFTRRLLWGARDGRADSNADGTVTGRELHDYLVRESVAYCRRHPHRCAKGLTPQFHAEPGKWETASFAPGRMPATASSAPAGAAAKGILVRRAERLVGAGEGGVRLDIEPAAVAPVGSPINIVVESDRDGRLVLIDISPNGEVVQIFPNAFSERHGVPDTIRAGHPLRIPGNGHGFHFIAEPPAGEGLLLAVVVESGSPLAQLASRHKDLAVIERPNAYLVELSEALRWGTSADWRYATRDYEIVSAP